MKLTMPFALWVGLVLVGSWPQPLAAADAKQSRNPDAAKADELFDQIRVLMIKIEIPAAGIEELKKDPKAYVKATLRHDKQTYLDAGIRLKGSGSSQLLDKKPSLAVKFNEFVTGARFFGHSRIFLNACEQDPTFLAQAVVSEIFSAAGVPAPRVSFARVELNGRDLGLYVIEQAVNAPFLSKHFKKGKGNLYEGNNADVNEKLEKDSGDENKDQNDLRNLVSAAQIGDQGQRWRKLNEVLDVDRFLSQAAVEVFLWLKNGYAMARNNYRVYHDPNTGKMVLIPHGFDQVLDRVNGPLVPEWKGMIAKAMIETPDGQRRYREQMAKLLGSAFKPETLHAKINELAGKIRPALPSDTAKAFDSAVATLRDRLAERAKFMDRELKQAPAK